jgi:hypothetical protein
LRMGLNGGVGAASAIRRGKFTVYQTQVVCLEWSAET